MMKRILITGAAGGLGTAMRTRLAPLAQTLRLADVAEIKNPAPNEEVIPCDMADLDAVKTLVKDCDAIVHLAGKSVEGSFPTILKSNIEGVYNLFEAARANGHPRIIFASSVHAVGYHKQSDYLAADCALKPDGLYGVSKCFGEAMASLYHSKFGQETAIVRIGSCFEKPVNHRMLSSWLSFEDFASLIKACFTAPHLGCPVIWGNSDNDTKWWDNSAIAYLGWVPKDNSAKYRAEIEAKTPRPAPDDPAAYWQGGVFTADPIMQED